MSLLIWKNYNLTLGVWMANALALVVWKKYALTLCVCKANTLLALFIRKAYTMAGVVRLYDTLSMVYTLFASVFMIPIGGDYIVTGVRIQKNMQLNVSP